MKMKMSKSPGASDLPGLVPHLLQEGVVLHNHRVLNVRALDKKFISIRTLVNILSMALVKTLSMYRPLDNCDSCALRGTFPLYFCKVSSVVLAWLLFFLNHTYNFANYHLWCWRPKAVRVSSGGHSALEIENWIIEV